MCKFWVIALIFLCVATPARAVDLSIKDPLINNLEISFTASLSATSNYYLQAVLRSQSSSHYFGETQNNRSDWIDYVSAPEKEYIASNFFITDIKDATWSGQLKIRFKLDDPNYLGPGSYDLKLRRFTGNSTSSAGESNTLSINLTAAIPSPSPAATATPSPAASATPTPTPSPTPRPSPSPSPTPKPPAPSVTMIASPQIGTVAGESTEIDLTGFGISRAPASSNLPGDSRQAPTLNKSRAKTAVLVGSGLIIISVAGYFGYRKYHAVKGSDLEG